MTSEEINKEIKEPWLTTSDPKLVKYLKKSEVHKDTEKEIPFKPITEQAYDGSTISRHHEDFDWRGINIPTLDEALKKEIKDHPELLYKGQGHIKVPFLTKQDLYYLADICWYIKGFVAAQKENDNNEFGQPHVDVLTKVINECKSN